MINIDIVGLYLVRT